MRSVNLGRLICALVFLALFGGLSASAEARAERAQENSPLVALLAPQDGAALNAATLRVQALVAAFKPHPHRSFVLNGQEVAGVNSGRVSLVEIALDDAVVERVEGLDCRRQLLVDSRLDLTGLADGPHTLTVTAFQGYHRARIGRSASIAFTLDRSLPLAEVNRVEEAATPAPFACFALRDDDDDDDERHGRRPGHADVHGRLVLGGQSDGIDLERDRVVIAAGSQIAVIEPGSLDCRERRNRSKCRFEDRSHPLVQRLVLEQKHGRLWKFRLRSGPLWPENATVYLRIGNDWGGIDLATGERLARLRQALDTTRQGQATIGPAGGTVQTTDAAGVVIRLDVPAGALTRDTLITLTPLLSSPLPDSSTALHPGVKFEPEGLVFATPATLTMDFSATGQQITSDHFIFLLTSPLTTLPLYGSADPAAGTLTARLRHFSSTQGGAGNGATTDLAAWADPILSSTGNLTLSEIESLGSLAALQQQLGCSQNCVDLAQLSQRAQESINALVSQGCAADVANPSDAALQRWIALEALGQQLGVDTSAVRGCEAQVLEALIGQGGAEARMDPSDANLQRLLTLNARAQQLNFPSLETLALQELASALRVLLAQGQQMCPSDPSTGQLLLQRAQGYAPLVSTVDPSLAGDIQNAINACQGGGGPPAGGSMTVFALGSGRTDYFGNPYDLTFVQTSPSAPCGEEGSCDYEHSALQADTPLPVTVSTSAFTFTVAQPQPNVVTVDATVTAPRGDLGAVYLGFRFAQPGGVLVEFNPLWQTSPTGAYCPQSSGYSLPGETWDGVVVIHMDHEAVSCPGGLDYQNQPFPYGNLAGSGRLATFTFTPSP